jgi:hypothetical protein
MKTGGLCTRVGLASFMLVVGRPKAVQGVVPLVDKTGGPCPSGPSPAPSAKESPSGAWV